MAVIYLENLRTMTPHRRNKLRILHLKIWIKMEHKKHMNQIWNLFYGLKNFCKAKTSYDQFGNITIYRNEALIDTMSNETLLKAKQAIDIELNKRIDRGDFK